MSHTATFNSSAGIYTDAGARLTAGVSDVFIPELWSSQLLTDTEDQLVIGGLLATSQYEGEFRREGDTIRIPHFQETVTDKGNVTAYGSIGSADRAELEYIKMQVARGSSFHFELDNLHQLQTKAGISLMSELVRQRARQTAIAIDRLITKTVVEASIETAADSGLGKDYNSTGGTAPLHGLVETVHKGTGTQARYNQMVDMHALLDDANAEGDRFLIIGTSVKAEILKMKEFVDAAHWGGAPVMVSGFMGSILDTPVIVSNTVGQRIARRGNQRLLRGSHSEAAGVDMILGTRGCIAAVAPHAEMKAYEPEAKFTHAVKSRIHYDAKVIVPHGIVLGLPTEEPETP